MYSNITEKTVTQFKHDNEVILTTEIYRKT